MGLTSGNLWMIFQHRKGLLETVAQTYNLTLILLPPGPVKTL